MSQYHLLATIVQCQNQREREIRDGYPYRAMALDVEIKKLEQQLARESHEQTRFRPPTNKP